MMIRGLFSDFYLTDMLPALRQVITNKYQQNPEMYSKVFDVQTSDRSIEQTSQMSGVGLLTSIGEAETIATDNPLQGFDKTFTHTKYGLAVPTSQEMVDDDKWRLVKGAHEALARSCKETIEITGAATFNSAFATVTGPDGKVLCASDHPLVKSGGTQSNVASVSCDLDVTSLQLALTDFETMKDSSGILIRVRPQKLIVAPANRFVAAEILHSADRPDTANRATNALKYAIDGMPDLMVWPHLTDVDAWFLTAAPSETGLLWFWRRKPYTKGWFDDWREVGYTAMRYRCSSGWSDFYGVWGNPGA
jgi:hypothetical protein